LNIHFIMDSQHSSDTNIINRDIQEVSLLRFLSLLYALVWKTDIEYLFKFQNNVNYVMYIFLEEKKDKKLSKVEIV
jgi:hypothetical protein